MEHNKVMDAQEIDRSLNRISHEILERHGGSSDLVIIGIQTRGIFLARRICAKIAGNEGKSVPLGILDITLYRDDINLARRKPPMEKTDIPFSLDGKRVVLVDDVLFTGRTVRAALDALMDFGRPKTIGLVVLIDRGHRELPIRADFVGKELPSALWDDVAVRLVEQDGIDEVIIRAISEKRKMR
ncbi:MAG: bifunctional pyr operon transcriptional regulator/uracil phosphoribosyltransferase PyrR [Deltaproteobacteria bacterium]|nr:bifunctional pyr operon transcriptional regulator/uracil phosphoribosyltransferase PyrR [Deltaproteobacteria bacterium]